MHRAPAGTMLRHDDTRIEFFQSLNRRHDNRLEDRTREMESADDGVNSTDSREISRMF